MDAELKGKIKQFVLEGIKESKVSGKADPFWQSLKNAGTELWLDTGDMIEAEKNWSAEMTALTTNNTLLNNEIQKGIYDDFISEAKGIVDELPLNEQIVEIAFILNARHGLRLAQKFGGFVSVELHTDTAHDFDAIVDYGVRYQEINPDQFIVKVPYTATGLLGARRLRELGVKINFTLEFSARQNVLVTAIAKPNYVNVFLGRLGAYVKDNGLGEELGIGERAVISTQKWVKELSDENDESTRLIAASLRNEKQLEMLAGVDVYTMPTKVASAGKEKLNGDFSSKLNEVYPVSLNDSATGMGVEKLWEVSNKEVSLAVNLDLSLPRNGDELIQKAHRAGLGDMFPRMSIEDMEQIAADGKIPNHKRWVERIQKGELAIDTLLNLAGLASFMKDQAQLDKRIEQIIS